MNWSRNIIPKPKSAAPSPPYRRSLSRSHLLAKPLGWWLLCVALPGGGHAGDTQVSRQVSPDTGLSSWKAVQDGFSIELLQVLPDYVRAVYASRGLPPELIEDIADYCVFGTIVRNESDAPLSWRLTDWRYVTPDAEVHPLKPKSQWVQEWREQGVPFRWTLLADEQTYQVGDWGQGFITLDLDPGDAFDLHYGWSQHGVSRAGRIPDVRCASERAAEG